MDIWEVMESRHSVRKFIDHPIETDKFSVLQTAIRRINAKTKLNIQIFVEEPEAFAANSTHYGMFSGCRNYIAMVGKKNAAEDIGYYGEELVLLAQELGLNTCWVALTYKKGKVNVDTAAGEKLHLVIALGYGETQGVPHKSRPMEAVSNVGPDSPAWFRDGVAAALLAPTAVNQQKFYFEQQGNVVKARSRFGFNAKLDLGIAKYHFELGAGKGNFQWG